MQGVGMFDSIKVPAAHLADGEIMGWVFELNCGFSFLNKPGEYFGYVVLDLYWHENVCLCVCGGGGGGGIWGCMHVCIVAVHIVQC